MLAKENMLMQKVHNIFKPSHLQNEPLLREHTHKISDPIIRVPFQYMNILCGPFIIAVCLILGLTSLWYMSLISRHSDPYLFDVDTVSSAVHITSDMFVSFGLDTSLLANDYGNLNLSNPKHINLVKLLSPARLRFGGTMADRLIFVEYQSRKYVNNRSHLTHDGGVCSYEESSNCTITSPDDILAMTGEDWLALNIFATAANLSMLFDLNVLLRDGQNWEPANAERLIEFSNIHKLNVDWQLGNEPNSFKHVFGTPINASQLAKDYRTLKKLLLKYPRYTKSIIVGPETTRPLSPSSPSVQYMQDFLKTGINVIGAVSWHQYYLNGRQAVLSDFIDTNVFNLLHEQILIVKDTVKNYGYPNSKIWLTETGSAYGGGAPGLSNTFAGTFLWLDKLGVAAKLGIDTVIRQSLYGGHYTMLSDTIEPLPDWWIAVLYKTFVGNTVLQSRSDESGPLRLYVHCTPKKARVLYVPAITVFGMNLNSTPTQVRIRGLSAYSKVMGRTEPKVIFGYYFTSYKNNLQSVIALLNGKPLMLNSDGTLPQFEPEVLNPNSLLEIPPYSIVFWVIHDVFAPACF